MAEVNELAIIFKKTMDEEGNEVFIPLRIVSGRYSEAENWFITKNGTAYHHMVESIYEENSYGCRKTIGELMTMYKNLTLKEIKEKPGRRWDSMAEKVLNLITAAVVAFMLAKIGL